MRLFRLLAGLTGAVLALPAAEEHPAPLAAALPDGLYAEITTPRGIVTAELFFQKTPLTVANFTGLAEGTLGPAPRKPYFNGLTFHRVVPGFVVQGGDPLGTGEGGPGYEFPDEFVPGLRHDAVGIVSMANDGPDTNGSQFFITLAPVNRLNYLHSVFGRVVGGLEVLPQIQQGDAMGVKILRIGAAAQAFQADDKTFAALVAKTKIYAGAKEPGPAASFDDPDKILPIEPPRAKAFNFKLANFERATGVKLVARIFAQAPPAAEDTVAGAYMHALATKLGVAQHGVLAAHFANDDWRVWIGDDWTGTFLGHPASAGDLAPEAALHKVKEKILDDAQAQGDADFANQKKAAAPDKPPPPAQQLKLQTDALLDRLIFQLEPK
jgi:cyclophilin family peptidyl-prolyl cis-trans isomerase